MPKRKKQTPEMPAPDTSSPDETSNTASTTTTKRARKASTSKEPTSQSQATERESPENACTVPTIFEGQPEETLIQAKTNLCLGMRPLFFFFEIERKGGPLGLTENLGEVRKKKPSERGHGAREVEEIIKGEQIKGPDEINSSIVTTEVEPTATSETQV